MHQDRTSGLDLPSHAYAFLLIRAGMMYVHWNGAHAVTRSQVLYLIPYMTQTYEGHGGDEEDGHR